MDWVLKLSQTVFYIGGLIIAILTYRKASNGLLNSINTEYHKKVIDRLAVLSQELYEEFDDKSDHFWARRDTAKEVVSAINDEAKQFKHELLTGKFDPSHIGVRVPNEFQVLDNQSNRIRSDPFIPDAIRKEAISYLDGRKNALMDALIREANSYASRLAKGELWKEMDENYKWFHNKLIDNLRSEGYGIDNCMSKVDSIRNSIQRYFEMHNPIKIK